ncbi:HmuY family protein [Nannocystis sp. SCPEA4]|uniref:HmuY family protein n=1 Tax=Nannocystis sp. SCPEA4 TaxID=2996787 RepID=UPI002271B0AE|nr:HmuY family protein [Nannocystis sp. SCPEA4]MCY1060940.1 HmuY family protein [Nannocystis sp. SCPEA4]
MTRHLLLLTLSLAATLPACTTDSPSDTTDGDELPQEGPVVTEDLGDGSYESILEATSEDEWTYFDFESKRHVEPADPTDDKVWDLAALRFNVKSNGGTSGTGGVEVAILDGTSFDAVTTVPTEGWISDDASAPGMGGEMANVEPGYAFDNWFDYNIMDHTLMPKADRVYVVRTPEGNHYKLEMLGFYDDAGTPGFVSFHWAALPAA